MSNDIEKIRKALSLFKDTIDKLNRYMMEINNINFHPYFYLSKMTRSGNIEYNGENFTYRFHGGGCEFIYNGIVLDYQIVPFVDRDNVKIKFSLWSFRQFFKSLGNNIDNLGSREVFMIFEELSKNGELRNLKADSTGLYYFP